MLSTIDKAQTKLTQQNRDDLYEARINPIATFNGVGVVIWGQKTLQNTISALDRINVRRLMIYLKKKVTNIAVQLLFEQNDDIVRQQFLSLINPILEDVRRDRGLIEFKVQLNSDVSELDTKSMTGKIFVKPTKTLEFIEVEFNITPSSVSFNDITQ
jgi:phage tail sheath protein FI